ncbi:MAG: hypothetical protein H7Z40_23930 [Phycisphaerae bacterium]|nr:hypothetical protein [Gemmatimonadaceae bacterium]
MPFFSHPVEPTGWLLPLVSGVLQASSFLFAILTAIAPIGIPILVAIVLGLFSWNLMKDPYPA